MENELVRAILDAAGFGYSIVITKELNMYQITCMDKDHIGNTSTLPEDHMTERNIAAVIDFNVEKSRKKLAERTLKKVVEKNLAMYYPLTPDEAFKPEEDEDKE